MQLRRQSNEADEDNGTGFNVSPLSPIAGSLHVVLSHRGQILFAKTVFFLGSGRVNLRALKRHLIVLTARFRANERLEAAAQLASSKVKWTVELVRENTLFEN